MFPHVGHFPSATIQILDCYHVYTDAKHMPSSESIRRLAPHSLRHGRAPSPRFDTLGRQSPPNGAL